MDDKNNNSSRNEWLAYLAFVVLAAGLMYGWQQTMAEHPEYLKHLPRGRW